MDADNKGKGLANDNQSQTSAEGRRKEGGVELREEGRKERRQNSGERDELIRQARHVFIFFRVRVSW